MTTGSSPFLDAVPDENVEAHVATAVKTTRNGTESSHYHPGDKIDDPIAVSSLDLGHRLGNFHSYYTFHPPSNRLEHMGAIFNHLRENSSRKRPRGAEKLLVSPPRPTTFRYCDLGCNEGDLTIEIARTLQRVLNQQVEFRGIDIDDELIQRANLKWTNTESLTGEFEHGNILSDLETKLEDKSIDLISLLSTTMWIHVNAGDDGLEKVLKILCQKSCRYLMIEPQPSKCYRNAMIRLRKMGRPELNISSNRLKWRLNLEDEIENTLLQCSFHRVLTSDERTSWNRCIHLYERRL